MSACEDCWTRAFTIARMTGQHQVDVYHELIAAPPHEHPEQP